MAFGNKIIKFKKITWRITAYRQFGKYHHICRKALCLVDIRFNLRDIILKIADVVIIGYGLAGAVAAITARELGNEVIII